MHDLVPCDLCQRTILKGERIETFVVGGDRQRVCELCSMRALRSGWQRESELERLAPDRADAGPRRSLWSRAVGWAEEQGIWGAPPPDGDDELAGSTPVPRSAARDARTTEPAAYAPHTALEQPFEPTAAEQLPEHLSSARERAEERRRARRLEEARGGEDPFDLDASAMVRRPERPAAANGLRDRISGRRREPREVSAVPTSRWAKIDRALELFNESEHRRTITGIGRALGEPWVSAAPLHEGPGAREVGIVVAWELSWYRYRVDLDDADQAVLLLDRGNEVDDLGESQRQWNVAANAEGRLALAVEAVS